MCICQVGQQIINDRNLIMFPLQDSIKWSRVNTNTQFTGLLYSYDNLTNPLSQFINRSDYFKMFLPLELFFELLPNRHRDFSCWKLNRLAIWVNLQANFFWKRSETFVKDIRVISCEIIICILHDINEVFLVYS